MWAPAASYSVVVTHSEPAATAIPSGPWLSGSVSGIEIGTANLEPRLLEPDNLAHLALIGPAEVLADEDPEVFIARTFAAYCTQIIVESAQNGLKAYVNYINSKGGVCGRKLKIVTRSETKARSPYSI